MIEFNNLTTAVVNEEFLRKIVKIILVGENKNEKEIDLSVAFVGQGRMRELNKKYRGKNKTTDILAFGQGQQLPFIPKSELNLGEAVICLREVKKNAKRFGTTFEKELARILIHGILHLLGYEHEKSEIGAKKMREKENYYLSNIIKT